MFNMASDSASFRTAEQLQTAGFVRDGSELDKRQERLLDLSVSQAIELGDQVMPQMDPDTNDRYIPLYEGKMIEHFDHRAGSFEGLIDRPPRRSFPSSDFGNPTP